MVVMPALGWAHPAEKSAMAAYLAMWGIFTAIMFVGTLKANQALQFVFASLAAGDATGMPVITQIAGYEGIICGCSAIYTGLAQVLNEAYKETVLPVFPVE